MESASIPNLTMAPQAPHTALTAPTSSNAIDSNTLPTFAQVVRDILVRTTTQNETQSAHSSQAAGQAASGSPRSISADSPGAAKWPTQSSDPLALNLVSLLSQIVSVPQVVPTE